MIVLGIDPGIAILGWSVIEKEKSQVQLRDFGVIRTSAGEPLTHRIVSLYDELRKIFKKFEPTDLAIETLFFVKNAKTLAQVGHARGVVLLAAGQAKIKLAEYAPKQIKLALTGFGGAEKKQMQLVVQRMLNLSSVPQPDDAADAVAVALCHTQYSHHLEKLAVTV